MSSKCIRKEVKLLQIEPNNTCGKYKESAHMYLVAQPNPAWGISPMRTPIVEPEARKSQFWPVKITWESSVLWWEYADAPIKH
jgi:hypothetical protein